ncbi:MAG: NAD-dependent epimerase/dehydratase family protein [Patescibacteria group bacterium]
MKRIGITGASGFVGKHLVSRFLADGYAVNVYVRDRSKIAFLATKGVPLRIFEGDIAEATQLEPFVKASDIIVHLAAGTRGRWTDYHQTTVTGSETLLSLAEKYGIERLLVMSSVGIYDLFSSENENVVTENHALEPHPELRGWYAHSKLLGENVFTSRLATLRVPVDILRAGLIYAENMKAPLIGCGFFFKNFCIAPGTANKRMPYVHVNDVYGAILACLEANEGSAIYNVVSTEQPTVRSIVEEYNLHSKIPVRFIPVPRILFAPITVFGSLFSKHGRIGRIAYLFSRMQKDVFYSPQKLMQKTGWNPKTPLNTAIKGAADLSSGDVRIAIIGCGFATQTLHAPAIQRIPRIKVQALYDADRGRAMEVRNKFFPNASVLETSEELSGQSVDFAVIVTPPDTHVPLAKEFVARGIHVLVEKPVSHKLREALDLDVLAKEHGVRVCVVNNYRFRRNVLALRRALSETIGEPLESISLRFWSGPTIQSAKSWREEFKNALTHEMAYHFLDLVAEFGGRVVDVEHLETARGGDHKTLRRVLARAKTDRGISVDIDLRLHPPYAATWLEFVKKDVVYKLHFYPESLECLSGSPTPATRLVHELRTIIAYAVSRFRKPPTSHEELYRLFVRAVKDPHEQTPVSIEDTIPALEFIDRITK